MASDEHTDINRRPDVKPSVGGEPRETRRAAWFAFGALIILLLFTHHTIQGENERSRLAAVDSLVLHGTFHIDGMSAAQEIVEREGRRFHKLVDMVYNRRDGHFYSSKPPAYTLLLSAVPALAHRLGAEFTFTEPGSPVALFLLTWGLVGGMTAAAFFAYRRKVGDLVRPLAADVVAAMTLGGTLFLTYSTTINHHTFTAALILLAFFSLGMAEGARSVPRGRAAAAGFLMGLAAAVDIGHGVIFSIVFAVYLLCYVRSLRTLVFFALGSIAPLATHCIVQYTIWGSVLPVQMIGGTKDYPLSYWANPLGPDAWDIPRTRYWLLTLFSMRGLFTLSPILLLGVAGLIAELAEARRAEHGQSEARGGLLKRPEPAAGRGYVALTVTVGVLFLIWYHSVEAPTNFCGVCYGFRWYIGFTPILAFYAARAYARWRESRRFRALFYLLGVISVAYAAIGMRYVWLPTDGIDHPLLKALRPLRGF